ncbi:hypothetical protein [uncultured Pseudomonas sp.]|jgi:hypothetical protein|uniref:hypothetical protein n=1 Tax=uncultured Pseudomonas sp. TaxID=114707 RepID=UPI00261E691B|nr:hypothetical protein [uncultured Pseudomonas sp.]
MSAKAAAPALIVAALALVGDYSSVSEAPNKPRPGNHAYYAQASDLSAAISQMVADWAALDIEYIQIVGTVLERNELDESYFLTNMQLLKAVRQLEASLQMAAVPVPVADHHLALRRAIAKVRTRLATIDNQFRQHFVVPTEFESQLSGGALAALATHTTRQLAKLA